MPIKSDRNDVLIFKRGINGTVVALHKIDIQWQELSENGASWVAFDYLYFHFKHPWIFKKEHVIQSIAKQFEILPESIHSEVISSDPESSTIRVKIPLALVEKEFLLKEKECKPKALSPLGAHSMLASQSLSDLVDKELSKIIENAEEKQTGCMIL